MITARIRKIGRDRDRTLLCEKGVSLPNELVSPSREAQWGIGAQGGEGHRVLIYKELPPGGICPDIEEINTGSQGSGRARSWMNEDTVKLFRFNVSHERSSMRRQLEDLSWETLNLNSFTVSSFIQLRARPLPWLPVLISSMSGQIPPGGSSL